MLKFEKNFKKIFEEIYFSSETGKSVVLYIILKLKTRSLRKYIETLTIDKTHGNIKGQSLPVLQGSI